MPLPPLTGHLDARRDLAAAHARGSLPHSLLVHGPPGIGKERFGLWIGQLLLCRDPGPGGPCEACPPCRLAVRIEHPDLHWFFPLPRPRASGPDRLREALEEARAEELARRREDPLHLPDHDRPPAYFVATIRSLQRLAAVRPTQGSRVVYVVGDAEAMVSQQGSEEAANAFLKLLEEPPPAATIVLTSSRPGTLLPTVLSRVLPVRLRPLSEEEVAGFLVERAGMEAQEARVLAARSEGAVGRALRLRPAAGEPGPAEAWNRAGRDLLRAALSSGAGPYLAAHARAPFGARDEAFLEELRALEGWLRDLLAVAEGGGARLRNPDAADELRSLADRWRVTPAGSWRAVLRVERAAELAAGNVSPQLLVADLLRGIRADLAPPAGAGRAAR